MKIFQSTRTIIGDLGSLTLVDVLVELEKGACLNLENYFLIEQVNPNHLTFGIVQHKTIPSQRHDFKYSNEKKSIEVISDYDKDYLRTSLLLFFPLIFLLGELTNKEMIIYFSCVIAYYVFMFVLLKYSLIESSKEIERDLVIRINYLLKEKGYL